MYAGGKDIEIRTEILRKLRYNIRASPGETPIFSTLGQLFALALENTKRLFPVRLNRLDDVLQTLLTKQSAPSIQFSSNLSNGEPGEKLFVLTNTSGINGAACILSEC